ncbi:MAG: DUF72 domain-containing protein [Gemmatimonadota bacterium]
MNLFTGTSGFAYKEWKGSFYPEDMKADAMLPYYAAHFRACEINNSFYRMPAEKTLRQWSEQVPPEFRFVLKASQKITHFTRLKEEARQPLAYFISTARSLGAQLGPILFQLPPNLKLDLPRLGHFLDFIPEDVRAAFEFRHVSWFDDAVFDMLRAKRAALCIADTEEQQTPKVATTSDWGYLRLRRVEYGPGELEQFAAWTRQQSWRDAYVFFKHEEAGTGPRLARHFEKVFEDASRGAEKRAE